MGGALPAQTKWACFAWPTCLTSWMNPCASDPASADSSLERSDLHTIPAILYTAFHVIPVFHCIASGGPACYTEHFLLESYAVGFKDSARHYDACIIPFFGGFTTDSSIVAFLGPYLSCQR